MALPWLLVLELALYGSCFVCGIITAASVTITQGNFDGKCMLYGTVKYNVSGPVISAALSSSPSLCYFVSAISVCVAVFCFCLTLYWVYTSCMEGEVKRERLWMNVTLGVCGVFLFFLLVTGCILKIGRDQLCGSLLSNVPNLKRCDEAQALKWASPYIGNTFYNSLHNAETAAWVNLFFWLIIGGLVFVQRRGEASGLTEVRSGGEDAGASTSETEPFFNRPGRPQ